jgi:hypothetical protein
MRMSRWSLVIGSLFLFGCGSAPSVPTAKMLPSVDVTGRWVGTYATNVGTMPVELLLKQDNANVTGTASVAGDSWTTSTYRGDVRGTVSGDVLSYTYPGGGGEVTVTAGDMRGMTDGGKTLLLKKQ